MVFTSLYNSKGSRVARYFKYSYRSLQCLKLSSAKPCLFLKGATENSIAGTFLTLVILRLPAHVLIGSEEWFLHTDTICIKSSRISWLVQSCKANVEIVACLDTIINRFVHLSNLNALSIEDIKKMAPARPLKARLRTFVLRFKLKSKLSLHTMDLNLLLSKFPR